MEWNRSEAMVMASEKCSRCKGMGVVDNEETVCKCVFRAVFRACYNRFVECSLGGTADSRTSMEHAVSRDLPGSFGLKNEEYAADFLLLAKRSLTAEEHQIFRYRYILGADWRLCCRKLGNMDKGIFHHICYRIQHKLGKSFVETKPYGLYPLDEYFGTGMRSEKSAKVLAMRPKAQVRGKFEAPLTKAA